MPGFDYEGALKEGYTEDEIIDHLSSTRKDFDVAGARAEGYSAKDIASHLSGLEPSESKAEKPKEPEKAKRTPLEKAGRLAGQYALGRIQGSAPGMVYDLAVAPLASEGTNTQLYRQNVFEDIERLAEQKQTGVWDAADQELLDHLVDQVKNPSKMDQYVKTGPDISIRGLAEKATGINLHPDGWAEKAVNFIGFLKDPKSLKDLTKIGLNPKELVKAISPSFSEVLRGAGAGGGLEMAEQGNFGPAGTIGAMIVGDLIGGGANLTRKAILNPKQAIAEAVNFLTLNNTQRLAATQLAEDFSKSGMTIDAGTLTGSPLVQMIQARLSQSGLTGTALDNFRKDLSGQVVKQYEEILGGLGELAFENNHQAAEAIKTALKTEEQSLNAISRQKPKEQMENARSLEGRISVEEPPDYNQALLNEISPPREVSTYSKGESLKQAAEDIKAEVKEGFDQRFTEMNERIAELPVEPQMQLANELERFIAENRGSLLLGESTAEARVLQAAENLHAQLGGGQFGVSLRELIQTKRTLGDVANWEFGGSNFESAYKKLVGDIDEAIVRGLGDNRELRNEFLNLNADYSGFKDTFESDTVKHLFEPKNRKYNSLYNEFSGSVDKIKALEEIAPLSEHGQEALAQVKRDFAQKVIEKPNLTAQDLTDLREVLGPEYETPILNFITERQQVLENPRQAVQQAPLGVRAELPQTKATKGLEGRKISETGVPRAETGLRKKLAEKLAGKSPDQVMQSMNTIEGIRELRKVLSLTPEGKELFNELSRFKMAEMIDSKMTEALTEQVKLGKFAGLLKDSKSKSIVKELLGEVQFDKLQLLQKNSGALAESVGKFFNASKSGTVMADVGVMGTVMAGLITGNPFMYVPSVLALGGSYITATLLADKEFLKYLEKAIRTNDPKKFQSILLEMKPKVDQAMQKQQEENLTE